MDVPFAKQLDVAVQQTGVVHVFEPVNNPCATPTPTVLVSGHFNLAQPLLMPLRFVCGPDTFIDNRVHWLGYMSQILGTKRTIRNALSQNAGFNMIQLMRISRDCAAECLNCHSQDSLEVKPLASRTHMWLWSESGTRIPMK